MKKVSCVGLIPAEYTVTGLDGLNVLVMAVGAEVFEESAEICLYGSVDGKSRLLTSKTYLFPPDDHAHLYFHIPAHCFAPEFWDGHAPEEITISAGTASAGPETGGKLIFIEQ